MLTLDWSILVAAAVFLATLWALNTLLFRPLFRVLDERRSRTSGSLELASEKERHRQALLEEYGQSLEREKLQGYQLTESVRREALEARQARLAQVREEAERRLRETKGQLEEEISAAREELKRFAGETAALISERILKSG